MADPVHQIADWLESFLRGNCDNPEDVVAAFKTEFPGISLALLEEAAAICEARMLERSRPEGTA